MSFSILLVIFTLLFLPGCLNKEAEPINQETRTLLIQAISDSSVITNVISELTLKINTIIKKELWLDQEYDFAFFLPKKLQRVTLYYVSDINQKGESELLSALEKLELMSMEPVNATLSAEFFGDREDELVMILNGTELSGFNQKIKAMANQLNSAYKKENGHNLYNIVKSERYPFIPHMGIGRIRSQSIKNHIKDASQTKNVFERIKTEIKKVTIKILRKVQLHNSLQISFKKFGVLDLRKQNYIKEW